MKVLQKNLFFPVSLFIKTLTSLVLMIFKSKEISSTKLSILMRHPILLSLSNRWKSLKWLLNFAHYIRVSLMALLIYNITTVTKNGYHLKGLEFSLMENYTWAHSQLSMAMAQGILTVWWLTEDPETLTTTRGSSLQEKPEIYIH